MIDDPISAANDITGYTDGVAMGRQGTALRFMQRLGPQRRTTPCSPTTRKSPSSIDQPPYGVSECRVKGSIKKTHRDSKQEAGGGGAPQGGKREKGGGGGKRRKKKRGETKRNERYRGRRGQQTPDGRAETLRSPILSCTRSPLKDPPLSHNKYTREPKS